MASNEPALIPTPEQLRGHEWGTGEWNTAEWNLAAGWTPPVTEQTAPTKGAVDGWDTAEWDMRAAWTSMPSDWPSSDTFGAGSSETPVPPVPLVRPYQGSALAEPSEATSSGAWTSESWFSRTRPSDAPEVHPGSAQDADAAGTRRPHEASDVYQADPCDGSGLWAGDPLGTGDPACQAPTGQAPIGQADVWNPSAEPAAPIRGRHRVGKQRSSGRGSAVFGVAAAAVLGVGGVAGAESHSPVSLSLPDLPEASEMPGVGVLVAAVAGSGDSAQAAPFDSDAGEALRTRILDQANQQRGAATQAKRDAAAQQAAKEAAAKKVRDAAAAKEKAAAEAARLAAARLAKIFVKPVASYTLTAGFGETSSLWVSTHTGQDFAAPTGTPVVAIHGGTVTSAGWAGSYGYRIILTLDDGTEIWYCHLSSMTVTSGKVTTGETIGRVGATGNVTGPHLHLEVRPDGGAPIDPMPWLRAHGLNV